MRRYRSRCVVFTLLNTNPLLRDTHCHRNTSAKFRRRRFASISALHSFSPSVGRSCRRQPCDHCWWVGVRDESECVSLGWIRGWPESHKKIARCEWAAMANGFENIDARWVFAWRCVASCASIGGQRLESTCRLSPINLQHEGIATREFSHSPMWPRIGRFRLLIKACVLSPSFAWRFCEQWDRVAPCSRQRRNGSMVESWE